MKSLSYALVALFTTLSVANAADEAGKTEVVAEEVIAELPAEQAPANETEKN